MKEVGLFFSLILLLTACPMDRERGLVVKNNSNQVIVVTGGYILPDTLLPKNLNKLININPNDKHSIYGGLVGDSWWEKLDRGEKLTLFVLSKDSIDKYSWDYLRENNVIIKRYEFNWEELDMIKWHITYP